MSVPARLRRLTLAEFRSYPTLNLELDGRSVVFTGANGAGKTNLLEALSMLGPGRGLRGAAPQELARQGAAGGWGVGVTLDDNLAPPRSLSLEVRPTAPGRRSARIDGVAASSATSFLDHIRFQWLTPAQDRLFVEGAADRRRFLDRLVLAGDPAHASRAIAYERIVRQRIEALAAGRPDAALLSILEAQIADLAVAIAVARRQTVARLSAGYRDLVRGVFPVAALHLEGRWEAAPATDAPPLATQIAARLRQMRGPDAQAGRMLDGPHRVDLVVTYAQKQQPARQCSTGEQKALLIGIVLAQAAALRGQLGVPLILLLDEVVAHLDADRREALAEILNDLGCQAFLTGTDAGAFAGFAAHAQRFDVCAGRISSAP